MARKWTEEQRAAAAARMRALWADKHFQAAQKSRLKDAMTKERRADSAARMKALNKRMKSDEALKKKNVEARLKTTNSRPRKSKGRAPTK